jgi:hypothetical protein
VRLEAVSCEYLIGEEVLLRGLVRDRIREDKDNHYGDQCDDTPGDGPGEILQGIS